jgi:hypothetical protein
MHVVLLAALWATGADPEPMTAPTGPAPQVAFLKVDAGRIVKSVNVAVPVSVAREIEVLVGGKKEKRVVVVTEYRMETRQEVMALDKATWSTASGKKLTAEEAKKRLAGGAIVLMSTNGSAVDKAYLKAFKSDTLVVVGPVAPVLVPAPVRPPVIRPRPVPLPAPVPAPVIRPLVER